MKKSGILLLIGIIFCLLTAGFCSSLSLGFKPLKPSDEMVLKNLRNKPLSSLQNQDKDNAKKILVKFFTENVDYEIWYKNYVFYDSLELEKQDCENKRANIKKSFSPETIKNNISANFETLLIDLQNHSALEIYYSFCNFAQVYEYMASYGCEDRNAIRKAKREAYDRFLSKDENHLTTYVKIQEKLIEFLLKAIEL